MKVKRKLVGHVDYIRGLDFHPTRPLLASCSDDKFIGLWHYEVGTALAWSIGHFHYIMSIQFIDSSHLATCSLDRTIGVWIINDAFGKKGSNHSFNLQLPLFKMQNIEAHDRSINCLIFKKGKLYSGSDDRCIKEFDYRGTLELNRTIYAHENNVTCIDEHDGIIITGSEDGKIGFTVGNKTKSFPVNTRIWSLSIKNDVLAVGSDDGLILFNLRSSLISDCLTSYYFNENSVFLGNSLIFKVGKKHGVSMISTNIEDNKLKSVIINFDNKFGVYSSTGSLLSIDDGKACYFKNKTLILNKNELLFDNKKIFSVSEIKKQFELRVSKDLIFLFSDKEVLILTIEGLKSRIRSENYIRSIISEDSKVCLLGINSIEIYKLDGDFDPTLIEIVDEMIEIQDAKFGKYKDEIILVYLTQKQIKYFYQEVGILCNNPLSMYGIISNVDLDNNELTLVSKQEEKVDDLALGEIRFRMAVLKNEDDIISVIEEEQLSGLYPMEYLIKKNKGSIALPYINEDDKKFELLLSEGKFNDAYEIAENINENEIYKKLYERIVKESTSVENLKIAESCLLKESNDIDLFYFYLCSKQFDKLNLIKDPLINDMVKLVNDDMNIFNINSNESIKNTKFSNDKTENVDIKESEFYNSKAYFKESDSKDINSVKETISEVSNEIYTDKSINEVINEINSEETNSVKETISEVSNEINSEENNKSINEESNEINSESEYEKRLKEGLEELDLYGDKDSETSTI
ncbi:COPA [Hepatospora eriocheir]|uniref:COPA n=1 Tax=Hepatospora eriocheir TaxID=1081669 RepID=A0A1X0QGR1_9MICR|nr:COPA [Hepatospora eriocheir]